MFTQLDQLLRGQLTTPTALTGGELRLPLRKFVFLATLLAASYGFFMGWYGLFGRATPDYQQIVACMIKLPALFLLTLIVTFPSLYVFNALIGCRLTVGATLRLLVSAILVNVTVAASFGPILGFFTFSTTSYPFMVLLNVCLLGLAGVVGLTFLLHTLRRLAGLTLHAPSPAPAREAGRAPESDDVPTSPPAADAVEPGPLTRIAEIETPHVMGTSTAIFQIWVIIYALVGSQMGWLLRPFIGDPDTPFTWFRERSGNFLQAIFGLIPKLFENTQN
ncbi:MAG: hypothetical protein SF069_18280 [Phycisphaerae bacterium]|nr:hypothetical protein [Phycisphaerae bacterium]